MAETNIFDIINSRAGVLCKNMQERQDVFSYLKNNGFDLTDTIDRIASGERIYQEYLIVALNGDNNITCFYTDSTMFKGTRGLVKFDYSMIEETEISVSVKEIVDLF